MEMEMVHWGLLRNNLSARVVATWLDCSGVLYDCIWNLVSRSVLHAWRTYISSERSRRFSVQNMNVFWAWWIPTRNVTYPQFLQHFCLFQRLFLSINAAWLLDCSQHILHEARQIPSIVTVHLFVISKVIKGISDSYFKQQLAIIKNR